METTKFKVGDKVRRINDNNGNMNVGDTGVIVEVSMADSTDCKVRADKDGVVYSHDNCNLELISSNKKSTKDKPIALHIVLEDGCNNFVSLKPNFDEAIKLLPSMGKTYTVYKLTPAAKLENTVKITKIKK